MIFSDTSHTHTSVYILIHYLYLSILCRFTRIDHPDETCLMKIIIKSSWSLDTLYYVKCNNNNTKFSINQTNSSTQFSMHDKMRREVLFSFCFQSLLYPRFVRGKCLMCVARVNCTRKVHLLC